MKIIISLLLLSSNLFALDVEKEILDKAKKYIGVPYRYGGESTNGFDCSGFIFFIYKDHVTNLGRTATAQSKMGVSVKKKDLHPGDLTFWATGSNPKKITHVSIYIGNQQVIHALSEGSRLGIRISDINSSYWKDKFLFARRVFSSEDLLKNSIKKDGYIRKVGFREFSNGVYSGEMINGVPDGNGAFLFENGDKYVGEMYNGVFHGTGFYTSEKGTYWEGEFIEGFMHGMGKRIWPGGEEYSGEFMDGVESGGWFKNKSGKTYWVSRNKDGDWEVDSSKTPK